MRLCCRVGGPHQPQGRDGLVTEDLDGDARSLVRLLKRSKKRVLNAGGATVIEFGAKRVEVVVA